MKTLKDFENMFEKEWRFTEDEGWVIISRWWGKGRDTKSIFASVFTKEDRNIIPTMLEGFYSRGSFLRDIKVTP